MPYKVRFHLAQGPNHRMWQVKNGKSTTYYNPESVVLIMKNCKLKNHKTVAQQIFNGSHKTVCAWIECEDMWIQEKSPIVGNPSEIKYNPRLAPHWVCNNDDVDNKVYNLLHTHDRRIFAPFVRLDAS